MDYGFLMIQSARFLINNNMTDIRERRRFENNRFIAHAGGEIDGAVYTNSLEALSRSYERGFRLFELDILETSDGKFVAAHDWESWQEITGYKKSIPPTEKAFLNTKILGKYTAISMEAINIWFNNHSDVILVTDKIN